MSLDGSILPRPRARQDRDYYRDLIDERVRGAFVKTSPSLRAPVFPCFHKAFIASHLELHINKRKIRLLVPRIDDVFNYSRVSLCTRMCYVHLQSVTCVDLQLAIRDAMSKEICCEIACNRRKSICSGGEMSVGNTFC